MELISPIFIPWGTISQIAEVEYVKQVYAWIIVPKIQCSNF